MKWSASSFDIAQRADIHLRRDLQMKRGSAHYLTARMELSHTIKALELGRLAILLGLLHKLDARIVVSHEIACAVHHEEREVGRPVLVVLRYESFAL